MKTEKQTANFLGCTAEQLTKQYKANHASLVLMKKRAEKTGAKVNGYTLDQLKALEAKYAGLAYKDAK